MVNGETMADLLHRGARRMLGELKPPPANLFDSGDVRGEKSDIDVDISGAKELPTAPADALGRLEGRKSEGARGDGRVDAGEVQDEQPALGLRGLRRLVREGLGSGEPLGQLGSAVEASWPRQGDGPDRKSTRLNSSHIQKSRMPSSA